MDLNNDTVTIADAEADVNKNLPSSIRFKFNSGGDSATFTPAAPLPKPVLKVLLARIRELNNIQIEKLSDGTGGHEKLLANIETLKKAYRVAKGINFNYRREAKAAKRAAAKAEREALKSQAKVVANKPEQDRVKARTNQLKADKVISETATNSDQIGKTASGFKSLTESTKPKTAIPKPNKVKKPEPSPSEMTESVPGITVTKSPSNKSNIDTLVASTTPSTKNLNKVVSAGSGKGIRKTLEDSKVASAYNIKSNQVNSAVNTGARLGNLTRDPAIQNNLKNAGLSAEEITTVNQKMDVAVEEASKKEIQKLAVVPQKDFATKQFRALGNPIGAPGVSLPSVPGLSNPLSSLTSSISKNPLSSLATIAGAAAGASNNGVVGAVIGGVVGSVIGKSVETVANGANNFAPGNPFGSLGMDFGNVLATVAGISTGAGPFKELGTALNSLPNGIDPLTKEQVPDLVQPTGVTQLAKTVNKGTRTAVDEPTTPVKEVGKTKSTGIDALTYGDLDNEFWGGYEPVNSKKELELEIKSSPRTIRNLIVSWTASGENEVYTAKSWNEKKYKYYTNKDFDKAPKGSPIGRDGFQGNNYLIRKDGVLERLVPIGTAPTPQLAIAIEDGAKNKYKRIYDQAIWVQFDAGILGDVPESKPDWDDLSDKSITAEQWKTFDMIADVMYRHSPGGVFKGADQLLNEYEGDFTDTTKSILPRIQRTIQIMGPQFEVGTYLEKKREIPDGEDGEVIEVVLDDDSPSETVEVEDPYSDLDDDFLNSEVINGNTVSYDEVRGRWAVFYPDTNTKLNYGTKDAAYFAARENLGE